jgi:hypothetical protein
MQYINPDIKKFTKIDNKALSSSVLLPQSALSQSGDVGYYNVKKKKVKVIANKLGWSV